MWFEVRIVDAKVGGEGAADDVTSRSEIQARAESGPATQRRRGGRDVVVRRRFVRHTPMKVTRSPLRKFGLAQVR